MKRRTPRHTMCLLLALVMLIGSSIGMMPVSAAATGEPLSGEELFAMHEQTEEAASPQPQAEAPPAASPSDGEKAQKSSQHSLSLAAGVVAPATIPVVPPPLPSEGASVVDESAYYRIAKMSAGFNHAAALMEDGTVWTWGYNNNGELGLGHTRTMTLPQMVAAVSDASVIDVSSGLYHTMALGQNGQVFIWGHNGQGQLGQGGKVGGNVLSPIEMDMTQFDGKVTAISAGYYHSLVLTENGTLYAWGDNNYGGNGLGKGGGDTTTPTRVDLPERIVAIEGGYSSSMILGESGTVYTTGYNGYGDLGLGHATAKYTFQAVSLPEPVVMISNNGYHMMVLTESGAVYGWGKNDMGEVGDGKSAHVKSPYKVSIPNDPDDPIIEINASYEHSSVLTESGKLYAWGNMSFGRLANGQTTGYQRTPMFIRENVLYIEHGGSYQYMMVITDDGRLWAAGLDAFGRMGNDKDLGSVDKSTGADGFVEVEFYMHPFLVSKIAVGFNHSLALAHDNTIWSWGYNDHGELGLGHTRQMTTPTRVPGLACKNIIDISVGLYHSMVLAENGRVFIWGHNGQGQLGKGGKVGGNELSMTEMDTSVFDGKVVAISCGYYHTLVITEHGTLYTWGDNNYGGTGLGTGGGDTTSPTKVSMPEKIVAIEGGYSSSMVLGESGTVYTTGYAGYGDLGLGNATSKYTFQKVSLPEKVVKISNNGYHMMALTESGKVYGWGKNDMGEVGDGKAAHVRSPYLVSIPTDAGDNIIAINAGYEHSTVLTESGKLYAWGNAYYGRLGNGAKTGYQRTPIYIRDGVADNTHGGGYQYQIIITDDGNVWAAGLDVYGRMGNDKDIGLTGGNSVEQGFVQVEFTY